MALEFNLGDIVTKRSGKKPAKVTYVSDYSSHGYYTCKYLHNNQSFSCYGDDLKLYEEETEMADKQSLLAFKMGLTLDNLVY